jgi:heat-inducible transcriptional repressor
VPTNKAYRVYVDSLLGMPPMRTLESERLMEELAGSGGSSPIEMILRRAAQTLGVLTQELGVALGPRLDRSVLHRLELVRVSSERLLMVLTLELGVVRTVFVEVPADIADHALGAVSAVLNDRLAGLTLGEIRKSLTGRLRDAGTDPASAELLNIFLQEGEQLFDAALPMSDEADVVLGAASVLAEQPEFSAADRMRRLLALTDTPRALGEALRRRSNAPGISITIGAEHDDPRLEEFTVVTAEYNAGSLAGVIGVIGPTRMPYDKVISLVGHTSRLLSDLLD